MGYAITLRQTLTIFRQTGGGGFDTLFKRVVLGIKGVVREAENGAYA